MALSSSSVVTLRYCCRIQGQCCDPCRTEDLECVGFGELRGKAGVCGGWRYSEKKGLGDTLVHRMEHSIALPEDLLRRVSPRRVGSAVATRRRKFFAMAVQAEGVYLGGQKTK